MPPYTKYSRNQRQIRPSVQGRKARSLVATARKIVAANNSQMMQITRPVSIANIVANVGELKGVDTPITVSDVLATTNTNVDVLPLNLVAPGNGSFNRVGRKIRMKSVRLFGEIAAVFGHEAVTGTLNSITVRCILVYDRQPSGVLPTFDTIFGHTLADGTEACTLLDPLRYDNFDRFVIIKDTRKSMNPTLSNEQGGTTDLLVIRTQFDQYVRLKDLDVVYSGQSAPQTIADISSGALYWIVRASANTASTTEVTVTNNSFARLRYKDV